MNGPTIPTPIGFRKIAVSSKTATLVQGCLSSPGRILPAKIFFLPGGLLVLAEEEIVDHQPVHFSAHETAVTIFRGADGFTRTLKLVLTTNPQPVSFLKLVLRRQYFLLVFR